MPTGRNEPCPCGSGRKFKNCCGRGGGSSRVETGPDLSPASELRRFAREVGVWEADLVPVPAMIAGKERQRTVAALVAAEDVALESDLQLVTGAEVLGVARIIEKALAKVARKVGVWPETVRVRRAEVAEALRPALQERGCQVEARSVLEALDPLARSLASHLSGRDGWPLASVPETWAAWGLPGYMVADLFDAYAAYYRAEPWRWLDDVPPLAAEWEDGSGIWTASVLGAGLGEFGLSVYSHLHDFSDLLELERGELPYQALKGWAIHMGYYRRQELPPVMVKEISRAGWKVESVEAYPYILPMQTVGGGLQRDLVRRLALLLRGVAGLVEKYGPDLRSPEGGAFRWSGGGLTLLFAVPPEMDAAGDPPPPDLQDLIRGIEEAGLGSEEEIQDFVAERVDGYNHTPLEGLAGLSPAQAQALIEGGVKGEGILHAHDALSAEELSSSDFLANARVLLQRLDEAGGTKATVAGNLTRAFVKEMLEVMRLPPGYLKQLHRMNKVVNEEDVWPLHVLRVNLDVAGLIKLRKGTFSITKRGRSMLPPESAGRLYAHLFRSYFGTFNMDYRSRFGRSSGLQSAVPLLLWQLGARAEKWISVTDLADLILPPRPRGAEDEGGWRNDAANLHHQVLDPLVEFGLLEEKPKPEAAGEKYPGLKNTLTRTTPLFDRFLRFVWD